MKHLYAQVFVFMLKGSRKLLICMVVATVISLTQGSIAQLGKRLVCGKAVVNTTAAVARTEVGLYFAGNDLLPGAATERDGTFCIENYVSDLSKPMPARLYVTSFCHPNDVALVNIPFWPRLRREPRFSGKRIIVGPGGLTSVGNVDVQLIYGHVSLRILNERHQPLLTQPSDWSPVWIRVRDQNGVTVHESGLSVVEIERSVDLKRSLINLALPEGMWTLEVALAGVPPGTSTIRHAVQWQRVPGQLKIQSCRDPREVNLTVRRTKGS
jgi:hypothetical protein